MIATLGSAGKAYYAQDTGLLYIYRSTGGWPGPTEGIKIQGTPGPIGPRGNTGPIGEQGPMGADGARGLQGPMGPQGITGATGPAGPMGVAGAGVAFTGDVTDRAELDILALILDDEDKGKAWLNREDGLLYVWSGNHFADGVAFQGPAGDPGATGPQGATGDAGAVGERGATGAMGPQGLRGDPGQDGERGATGATGPTGPPGGAGETHTASFSYATVATSLIRIGNMVMWSFNGSAGAVSGTPTLPVGYRPAFTIGFYTGQSQGSNPKNITIAPTGVVTVTSALAGAATFAQIWLTAEPYPI